MLKVVDTAVTFSEYPNEIALCLNISNCPNHCKGCSSSYLAEDIGEELDLKLLSKLITENKGITLVGFQGGDSDPISVMDFAAYIHHKYNLKVGMYSGRDWLHAGLVQILDYYKYGGWKQPQGDESTWRAQRCGPLSWPNTNQVMLRREDNKLIDITTEFQKVSINNLKNTIIL